MEGNKKIFIDWSKFTSNTKEKQLLKSKSGYIEFCEMLNETDFELVSDYINAIEKVGLIYKLNDDVKLNIRPSMFKAKTYKTIINFKDKLLKNGDKFVKFVGLTNGKLIAQIKTFDGGIVEIDISRYELFIKGRQDFYNKLKEVNGRTVDSYKNNETKINIYIDGVKLNPIKPSDFKTYTYKAIINFKNNLVKNGDKFIKFIDLNNGGNLIAKIKTFDGVIINVDISQYNSFNKGRENTYDYCNSKRYKILSPYISATEKILVDFSCGHDSNWITPANLKQGINCPTCSESKGENTVRLYLENNNINFIQEYRFKDCIYKNPLPFDFYIPKYNLCIEFDGRQHFEVNDYFGGKEGFKLTQTRDKVKNNYCKDNNINLLRIPYWDIDSIEDILDKEFDKLGKF